MDLPYSNKIHLSSWTYSFGPLSSLSSLMTAKWLSTKKSGPKYQNTKAPHGDPRPDILSPWRRRLSLPIPCHVHWLRSCYQSHAHARLPYAKRLVSGDLLGACRDVCVRTVPAYGVRGCGVGARQEPGQRHGCGEAVPGVAGGRRTLVGNPLQWHGNMWVLYGRSHGELGDAVSSRSAGSSMRGRLGCCGVRSLFRGFCSSGHLGHSAATVWGKGSLRKCS